MYSQEQLTAALKAFGEALPAGTRLHCLKVTPSVGYADTEAAPVFAFVLADNDEDFQRLGQVIQRGIKAYETEPGLTAALLRQKPKAATVRHSNKLVDLHESSNREGNDQASRKA